MYWHQPDTIRLGFRSVLAVLAVRGQGGSQRAETPTSEASLIVLPFKAAVAKPDRVRTERETSGEVLKGVTLLVAHGMGCNSIALVPAGAQVLIFTSSSRLPQLYAQKRFK